jgi:hypothetical protein
LTILENNLVQLQQRASPISIEKAPASQGIKHISLPPDTDGPAAEANLATV